MKTLPAGWNEDDTWIGCYRIPGCHCEPGTPHSLDGSVFSLRCELCGVSVAAAPATVAASQTGAHVICRECAAELLPGREVKFGGTIKRGATELPK